MHQPTLIVDMKHSPANQRSHLGQGGLAQEVHVCFFEPAAGMNANLHKDQFWISQP